MRSARKLFPFSMAARLTWLFVLLSVGLLGSVLSISYARVERHLESEHRHLLAEAVAMLAGMPIGQLQERARLEPASADTKDLFAPNRYGFRLQTLSGEVVVESPGMQRIAAMDLAEPAGAPRVDARPRVVEPGGFVVVGWQRRPLGEQGAGFLIVALNVTEDVELLGELKTAGLALVALAGLLAAVLGQMMASRGLLPLRLLTGEVQKISARNLSVRVRPEQYPQELNALVLAFNGLMTRLEKAFDDLAAYSANLAHELRTPLAALRGEIEVALLGQRSEAEYRSVLESALEELERLSRLVDKLLFLARADRYELAVRKQTLLLHEEAKAVLEFYAPLAEAKGVELVLQGEAEGLVDRDLFRQALANLVANALQHVGAGGAVTVTVAAEPKGTLVSVKDDGPGIDPQVLPRLFQRFATGRQRRGMGLGLAIVRSIAELHGGHVSASSEPSRGTEVSLWFPLA